VHSLPHRRHGVVLGLVNVRGELLLCVSVGRLLGLNHGASSEKLRAFYDRLLVVSWTGQRLAIPADEVRGIYRFQPDELAEPPTTVSRSTQTFTQGLFLWEGRPVGLFNPDLLLSSLNRSLS
jgi:chemotaxis-related protein WspD